MLADESKTKQQLIDEAEEMRQRITELEESETERKRAEEGLRESQRELSRIYDSVGDVLFYLAVEPDDCFRFLSINQAFMSSTGLTEDQIVGKRIEEVIPEPSVWMVRDNYKKAIEENRVIRWEETSEYPIGVKVGVVSIAPFFDDNGICTHLIGSVNDITERKKAEEGLSESEDKYRKLFELSSDALFLIEVETSRILDLNDTALKMYGYSREEALQMKNTDFSAEPGQTRQATVEHEQQIPVRYHKKKDGTITPTDISVAYYTWHGKEVCIAAIRDITERKKAEEMLRESEERFRALVESTGDFIWEVDVNGVYTYCSPQIKELWGYTPEESIGKTPFERMIPEDRERFVEVFRTISESQSAFKGIESSNYDSDGRVIMLETSGVPFYDVDGRLLGYRGISRDITERKQAEEATRVYVAGIDNANEGIAFTKMNGDILYFNKSACRIFGYTPAEMKEINVSKFSATSADGGKLERSLRKKGEFSGEIMGVRKNGQMFPATLSVSIVNDDKGNPIGRMGVFNDITERKQAEDALRESEEKFRLMFESVADGITVVDMNGVIIDLNGRTMELHGFNSKDELLGKSAFELIAPLDHERATANMQKTFEEGSVKGIEYTLLKADGSNFPGELSASVLRDQSSNPIGFIAITRDITERKRDEEARGIAEQNFRSSMDNSPLGISIGDVHGQPFYVNKAHLDMFGYSSIEEMLAVPIDQLITLQSRNEYQETKKSDEYYLDSRELSIIRKDGEIRQLLTFPKNVIWNGKLQLLTLFQDVTELRLAEETLRESEEKFAKAFRSSPALMSISTFGEARFIDVNDAFTRVGGYSREEVIGHTLYELGLTGKEWYRDTVLQTLEEGGKVRNLEMEFRTRSGEIRLGLFSVERVEISGKLCTLTIAMDITERRLAERAREVNTSLLRLLNASNSLRELMKDVTALLKDWSGCDAVGIRLKDGHDFPYYETVGFPAEHILGESKLCAIDQSGELTRDGEGNPVLECMCGNMICGRFDPSKPFFTEKGSFWTNSTTELLASTTEEDRQARTRNTCNGEGYESVALIPLRHGGETLGLLQLNDKRRERFTVQSIYLLERLTDGIAIAIAQRKAQEELQESLDKLAQAQRIASVGSWEWDVYTGEEIWSDEMCRIYGVDSEKFGGTIVLEDVIELIHPDDAPKMRENVKSVLSGGRPSPIEYRIARPDGTERVLVVLVETIFDDSGKVVRVIGTVQDITERKRAEEREKRLQEELNISSRLASIGELAAGVAHEINNPLTGVVGFSERLLRKSTDEKVSRDLERIHSEALRASQVVSNLLTFARRREIKKQYSDINDVLGRTLELRAYDLRTSNIELEVELTPGLPRVMIDFQQIQQVFLNIILNAEQVMTEAKGGGKLGIQTRQIKGYIRTSFADDGPGITTEHQARLFDPFFTTRGERGGTGLGLSVCHGILAEHGGRIYARSKAGKGSTFFVELPLETESAGQPVVSRKADKARG